MNKNYKNIISVAPMMDWTDRHCRYFHRLLSPNAYLYTEMVTTGALIHGDKDRFLRFDESEKPLALQLGGNDPSALTQCAKMAENYGYDEVNLNCGCPSDRVQSGAFGACLMREADLVAECINAMIKAVNIPITVKCRIGIDDSEEFVFLNDFISKIKDIGCDTFIIHARKAWLKGLSPKENREVPPLRYDIVQELKDKYPNLNIILNGGIKSVEETQKHLKNFDGVMIGREAYSNPMVLVALEKTFFNSEYEIDYQNIILKMADYADKQAKAYGTPLKSITRHMTGLFQGQQGARKWRQKLSDIPKIDGANGKTLIDIYSAIKVLQHS